MKNERNKMWWEDIHTKCLKCSITQERLSGFIGISRRHFVRLKKGEAVLTEDMKNKIEDAVEKLNLDAPLNLVIDYVRIRFPTTDICHIIRDILKLKLERTLHEDSAHTGYDECYRFWAITISVSQDISLGCLLEMKGQGCRQFEGILEAQNRSWYDFFLLALNEYGKFKRLDLAINDLYGILNIGELTRKWEHKERISKLTNHDYYRSGKSAYQDEKDYMGETLYLGSRKSEIYFCIYEKDYEQYINNGIPIEEAPVKNRFEIRLKNERAENAVEDLLTYRDAEHTAFGIINHYVRFTKRTNTSRDKETIDPRWEYFVGEHRNKLKLTTAPAPFSLEKTMNWLSHQVVPTWKMVLEIDEVNGTNYIEQMCKETELSEKHKKMVEQATLSLKDFIEDN